MNTQTAPSTESEEHEATVTRLSRVPAVLRAMSLLVFMAFSGWLLAQLGRFDAPLPRLQQYSDRDGNTLVILQDEASRYTRTVLSRVPLEVHQRGSILIFGDDGSQRVLPRNAGTVLVHPDGRVEALSSRLPRPLLPPVNASLAEWFRRDEIQAVLNHLDPRLGEFWEK